ncbi:sperm acrosome membrane-associated protein 4-like [Erpetoichthys calabaricus]|uniref:sperm acrosome membrane-associated protein 4-like n=1 Tax=Erpetoichthys calabaricus TaxID=27687 RepID=UPI0022341091|nr:sperm acrosome membrane-associated protein 4-like [Erpetoichthys calabaricus]
MNRTLVGVFALVACFTAVHALQCYECDFGVFGLCSTSKINCTTGQSCYNSTGSPSAVTGLKITAKGCRNNTLCASTNITTNSFLFNINYTISYACCSGELCNGGTTLAFSMLTAIVMATVWFGLL